MYQSGSLNAQNASNFSVITVDIPGEFRMALNKRFNLIETALAIGILSISITKKEF